MHQEAAHFAQKKLEAFEVIEENTKTVDVFVALESEWNLIVGAFGGIRYLGLKRPAIQSTLELMGIERSDWPEIFNGLRMMESAARPILNSEDR